MIRISPRSRLSWSFDIAKAGTVIGSLDLARIKSGGSFSVDQQRFEFKRERLFGPLALLHDGRTVARAKRAAVLRPLYRIYADDRQLDLRGSFMLRSAKLVHGDVVIATIRRPSFFRRILDIELQQNAPLPLVVFASTVMILFWRTASRSASGG
jgi:hypothetical protein